MISRRFRAVAYLILCSTMSFVVLVSYQNCAVQQSAALAQLNSQGVASFQSVKDCLPSFSANSGGYVFGFDPIASGAPVSSVTPQTYSALNDSCLIKKSDSDTTPDDLLICVKGPSQHDAVMEVVYGMKSPAANTAIPATSAWIFPYTNANQNGAAPVVLPPSTITLNSIAVAFWELNTDANRGSTVLAVTAASIAGTTNGVRCYITFGANSAGQPTTLTPAQQATDLQVLERAASIYLQTLN